MKKHFKRMISLALAITMVFGSFVYSNADPVEVNEDKTWAYGFSINADTTYNGYVTVTNTTTLTIPEGCTVTLNKGLRVPAGVTFTLEGSGKLIAKASDSGQAGIGGYPDKPNAGTIIINGCTVEAEGGEYAAGIGGGYNNSTDNGGSGGTITINGGNVSAISGNKGGAGIGGGRNGASGTITINDGTVYAKDNCRPILWSYMDLEQGAAIGSGYANPNYDVTINGGSVTADTNTIISPSGAAVIGCGRHAVANGTVRLLGGKILISGGYLGSGSFERVGDNSRIELSWNDPLEDYIDACQFGPYLISKTIVLDKHFYGNNGTVFEPGTTTFGEWREIKNSGFNGQFFTPGVKKVEFYSHEDTLLETLTSYTEISKNAVAPSENPVWEYGTFQGWYDSYHDRGASGEDDRFDFTKEINEDTKIYAGWNRLETNVQFLTGYGDKTSTEIVGDELIFPDKAALVERYADLQVPEKKSLSYWKDNNNNHYEPGQKLLIENRQDYIFAAVWEDLKDDVNFYDVRFLNYDGSLIKAYSVEENTDPIYDGATPTRESDAQFTYTFSGWDRPFSTVTEDQTYTAVYSNTVNTYTVQWIHKDSSTSAIYVDKIVENLSYGSSMPTYDKGVPSVDATTAYTYTFNRWESNVAVGDIVTCDVTYTAVFDAVKNKYEITFVDENGTTVLQQEEVEYGMIPVYTSEAPVKAEDDQYVYSFIGWDPEISKVTEDKVYTAVYSSESKEVKIESVQLVLSGQLGMNFFVALPDGQEPSSMKFTVGRRTQIVDPGAPESDGRYKFTCYINAAEMAETITAEYENCKEETSVEEYIDKIIRGADSDAAFAKATPLAKAIYNYGYYVQKANLKNGTGYKEMSEKNYLIDDIVNHIGSYTQKGKYFNYDHSTIESVAFALELCSETSLKFYIKTNNELTKANVYTDNSFDYTVEKVGDYYCIEVPGIAPSKFEKAYFFTLINSDNTLSASVLSYITANLKNTDARPEMQRVSAALYNYYQEAINYK